MNINYQKFLILLREESLKIFRKYSIPRWAVFLMDNLAVLLTFFIAYLLRFNFETGSFSHEQAFDQAFIILFVYGAFSLIYRSYSGLIRHATLTDITQVFIVTSFSAITLLIITYLSRVFSSSHVLAIPISVILIHYVLITVFLFFFRIFIKIMYRFATNTLTSRRNVLIYGAGELGFIVKRVLLSDPKSGFNVSGFLDKNKNLQGKEINGLPVYSPNVLTPKFVEKHNIQVLIIAIKNISPKNKSEIIRIAIDNGLEVLDTPAINKWLNGQPQVNQFKNVELVDLLGRETIKLNLEKISKGLKNKVILVTGAAGSIGSEIVRQLARFNCKRSILVDMAETPMFHLGNELKKYYTDFTHQLILADVTNVEKMELIFREFEPDIVFHAAAYKHLPLMEENPHEAFRINVGGTNIISELSLKYGVKKFVMISTDKSVNPTSVMGVSKRICEMIIQSRAQQSDIKTQFITTRFGNVLGSNGSVVPLFTRQIQDGGPVTVTHPEISRFFMTIPEACQLVLEAGFMGKGGEIFVFDMGTPVKIVDLANQMIKLSGLTPGKDIEIVFTGLRPGEKLYEELLNDKETLLPTYNTKIKIAQVIKLDYSSIASQVEMILGNLYNLSKKELITYLTKLVPEFQRADLK